MARDLRDKVIAITGASSGIGAATAVACAEAGMHVAMAARNADRLKKVADRVEALDRQSIHMVCDVTNDDDVSRFVTAAHERFGRLDAVFANAGYGLYESVTETSDRQLRDIFETNFFGTMRVIWAAVPIMRRQGHGHVLICSSSVSEIALPMNGAYCATKAAQDSIAGSLRGELAHEGIDVTSVHPIGTKSEFFDRMRATADNASIPFNTPPGAMQTPQKVAAAIVKALRKPKAEVWPSVGPRIGMAICTAFPGLAAMAAKGMMKKFTQNGKMES